MRIRGAATCSVGLVLLLASGALAAVPAQVTVQGHLKTAGGSAVDGNYNLTIGLYAAETGGDALWVEPVYDVIVAGGVFRVTLGNNVPVPASLLSSNAAVWVQVGVDNEPPLPRQRLSSVPYALVAGDVDCVGCIGPEDTSFLGDCNNGEALVVKDGKWGCGTVVPELPPVAGVPTGTVVPFAGATAPTGWALCNGTALSRTEQAELFTAIGITWGAGDGTTTFGLPDLRGRLPVGAGVAPGLSERTVGDVGGAESIALSQAQLPPHTHPVDPPSASTSENGNHTHVYTGFSDNFPLDIVHNSNGASGYQRRTNMVTKSAGNHQHSVDIGAFDSGAAGGGQPAPTMPPFAAMNYIIKL